MIMNIGATAFRHTIKFSKAFPPILKIRVKSKYTSKICKKQSGSSKIIEIAKTGSKPLHRVYNFMA